MFCDYMSFLFKVLNYFVAANQTTTQISALLTNKVPDRMKFSKLIMSDPSRKFEEKNLRYKLEQCIKRCVIMNNISDYVTLVHLMDSIVNVNHAVSVSVKFVFDSNDEKALPSTIEPLNIIFCLF